MAEAYSYIPLKSTSDTRVFTVEPGQFGDPIKGSIKNISLDDLPYEAISYVWGDATDQVPIGILCPDTRDHPSDQTTPSDAKTLTVPRTLHVALNYLRFPDRARVLWADSICVNQADKVEKGTHVANMGRIYECSEQVLMWQGNGEGAAQGELKALEQLMHIYVAGPESEGFKTVLEHGKYALTHFKQGKMDDFLQSIRLPDYAAVASLLRQTYFRRMWTLQEGVLGKKRILVQGHETCSFAIFEEASLMLNQDRLRQAVFVEALKSIFPLVNENPLDPLLGFLNMLFMLEASYPERIADWDDSSHLMNLMRLTADRQCVDPRDGLFALLHLAADVNLRIDTLLVPDYTVEADEIFHRVAVFLISQKKCYNWLTYAKGHFEGDPRSMLEPEAEPWRVAKSPSWAPLRLKRATLLNAHYRGCMGKYWSRGGLETARTFSAGLNADPDLVLSTDWRTLTLTGRFIDTIPLSVYEPDWVTGPVSDDTKQDLHRAACDIHPDYGQYFGYWLLHSLRGCYGDAWKTTELPDEAWLLYARCNQTYNDMSMERLASLIKKTASRFQAVCRKEVPEKEEASPKDAKDLILILGTVIEGLNFKWRITETGRPALVPHNTRAGDRIVVFNGIGTPLVLRAVEEGGYRVVGDCAVSGVMDGEVLQDSSSQPAERIALV